MAARCYNSGMAFNPKNLLRMMLERGGEVSLFLFVELGLLRELDEFLADGLVTRTPRASGVDLIRLTEKGRKVADSLPPFTKTSPAES